MRHTGDAAAGAWRVWFGWAPADPVAAGVPGDLKHQYDTPGSMAPSQRTRRGSLCGWVGRTEQRRLAACVLAVVGAHWLVSMFWMPRARPVDTPGSRSPAAALCAVCILVACSRRVRAGRYGAECVRSPCLVH